MPEPVSVYNTLLDAIHKRLTDRLRVEVDADDMTKAGVVMVGRLQDDPTTGAINIQILPGDETWPHELNTQTEDDGPGLYMPTYEVGSNAAFWRERFSVDLTIHISVRDRNVARRRAWVVFSRLRHALMTIDVPTEPDGFGARAMLVQVNSGYMRESGGEGNYQWTGSLKLEFITAVEPPEN